MLIRAVDIVGKILTGGPMAIFQIWKNGVQLLPPSLREAIDLIEETLGDAVGVFTISIALGDGQTATFTVNMVPEVKVLSSNSPTGSGPKYIQPTPQSGDATNLFAVWPGEWFTVKLMVPPGGTLPANFIHWDVASVSIPDNTTQWTFTLAEGTHRIRIQFPTAGVTKDVWVSVPTVGLLTESQAALSINPISTAIIADAAYAATTYTNDPANFPTATPRRDALRHSMWMSLSVSRGAPPTDAIKVGLGHEFDNKNTDLQQAFNTDMDGWNNLKGAEIMIPGGPMQEVINTLTSQYNAGFQRKYDGEGAQQDSQGILENSNGTRIIQ